MQNSSKFQIPCLPVLQTQLGRIVKIEIVGFLVENTKTQSTLVCNCRNCPQEFLER